ncbi:MAG: anti-sigma factor [Gemmatimonadales bacterium]
MEHLKIDTLARLVDERASPEETKHLAACEACASELAALMEQTESLGTLPEILPPRGDWEVLAARLRSDGLMRDPGLLQRLGLTRTPSWMPAAAAVVLFLGGTAFGTGLTRVGGGDLQTGGAALAATVEDAASAVRVAEQEYVTAVSRYRELMEQQGGDVTVVDPVSRYAALEHLVSVSQAAVRQAPGDPFLNGFLASALAERDAAARQVSTVSRDNWF